MVWDKDDYLREADNHLSDTGIYAECDFDHLPALQSVISDYTLSNIKRRGDINEDTLKFFNIANPRLGRFYLLPKIHKRLHSVPGRPVISNSSYYTENISSFLDFHLQPLSKKVKSYIKDTNDFLCRLKNLPVFQKMLFCAQLMWLACILVYLMRKGCKL